MKPFKKHLVLLAAITVAGSPAPGMADVGLNPYQAIVERNPFGLKPPPPLVETPPPAPPATSSKVLLTGIYTLFGVRALLEITEQEPGKQPTVRKPILKEGERDGSIEVVSIDAEKSLVKIRNGGMETNITFEAPKLGGSPAPAMTAAVPNAAFTPPPTASVGAPAIFTPSRAADNPARNAGMTMFGNSASAAPGSGFAQPYGGTSARSPGTFGGFGSSTPSLATATATTPGSLGFPSTPPRPLRTDNPVAAVPGNMGPPVDPAKQYLEMAIDHEIHSAGGTRAYPPLPPPPPR